MTMLRKIRYALLAIVAGLGLFKPLALLAVGPSPDITAEHLVEAGLHLPSYMPTVVKLMEYQSSLTHHQELKVEWDSLPGQTGVLRLSDVEGMTLAPNFTLLERRQGVPRSAGKMPLWVNGESLIIVAVTSKKQVRGLRIEHDPRQFFSEDLLPAPGHKQARDDFVVPKAAISFVLPDDPQIQTVIFFKPAKGGGDGGWRLKEVGRLALPPN